MNNSGLQYRFHSIITVLFCVIFSLIPFYSFSTHLMGGNMAYEYIGETAPGSGQFKYRIIFTTYTNCDPNTSQVPFPESSVNIGIYTETANPANPKPLFLSVTVQLTDSTQIKPSLPNNCTIGSSACIYEGRYITEVILPAMPNGQFSKGYHVFYDRCCRNFSILNLNSPGTQGMGFYAFIPPPITPNSSPQFTDKPLPFICVGDTTGILNTAYDADGDLLIFSFEDPYKGFSDNTNPLPPIPNPLNWPIPVVNWATGGYNKTTPFGPSGFASINAFTGASQYKASAQGNYVVAVEIKEYRNGNLIGLTRRDMQILAISCPPNPAPNLSASSGSGQTSYTIQEGETLCFPVTYTDPNNDSLTLVSTGNIFNPSVTNPPATITSPVKGKGTVSTQFCWSTVCGQAQSLPYVFNTDATDNGCPPKSTPTVYSITVNPFQAPTQITGPNSVCGGQQGVNYSVTNISGAVYTWTVTGGSQVSGGNTNSIGVDWGTGTSGNISVTITSQFGCVSSPVNLPITIGNTVLADAGKDTTLCNGKSVTIGGNPTGISGATFSWSPSSGLNNPLNPNPIATPSTTTTYIVTVTASDGCQATDQITIVVTPGPSVFAGNDTSICKQDTIQLNASSGAGVTYSWNPPALLNNPNISNPKTSPSDTTTFIVTVTDASGCINTDTITVNINPLPQANAGPDTWICPGTSTQLNAVGGNTYQWFPTTGLSNSNISNPVASPADSTLYVVSVTNAFGCNANDSVIVFVNAKVPTDAGNDSAICINNSIVIGGNPSSPNGTTFLWTPAISLNDPTLSNPTAFPITGTMYYLFTTNDTCTGVDSVFISVNQLPVADAGIDSSVCTGKNIQLNASGGSIYNWSPSATLNNSSISNPLASPNTTTLYTVTVTDGNGCNNSDSVLITVLPLPTADAGTDSALCKGDTIQLFASGGNNYLWSPNIGLSNNSVSNPFAFPAVSIKYFVTVTDGNNCSNSDSVQISVNNLPVVDAGKDSSVCFGDSIMLFASGTGIISYNWFPSVSLNNPLIPNPIAFPQTSSYYFVTGTDNNGCNNLDSVFIITNPLPVINAGKDTALCIGDTIQLNASGGNQYSWFPSSELNNSAISNPYAFPSATTNYIVNAIDVNSCKNTDSVLITVNQLPFADAGQVSDTCKFSGIVIGGSPTGPVGASYLWSPAAGLVNPSSSNPVAIVGTNTLYTVLVTDTNNCKNTDTLTVRVFSVSTSSDTSVCSGDSVQLYVNTNMGEAPYTFRWFPGNWLSDSLATNPFAFPPANQVYSVIVNDKKNCTDTVSIQVLVNTAPDASFTYIISPSCDGVLAEFENTSTGFVNLFWNFGNGATSSSTNPSHTFLYGTIMNVTLTIISDSGCTDTSSLSQNVSGFNDYITLDAGNIFTPNGDGINDWFELNPAYKLQDCENVNIYNRWGELVFASEGHSHSWDGKTFTGMDVPEGVYFYVITVKEFTLKGSVMLVR